MNYFRLKEDSDGNIETIAFSDNNDTDDVEFLDEGERFALPVKIYNKEKAKALVRKLTFGHHDEEFARGVREGIFIAQQEDAEIDYGM